MKKIFFVLVVCFAFIPTYSQREMSAGFKAKNAGNEAFKAKDYLKAISNWETYFASGEKGIETDSNTINLYNLSFKYAAFDLLKKQQWTSSLSNFEKYLEKNKIETISDGEIAYCMAYCAYQSNKNEVALAYFQRSIELKHEPDVCKLYMAAIYKREGLEQKMKIFLIETIRQHPQSIHVGKMKAMLVVPLLKDASVPFNIGNEYAKKAINGPSDGYVSNRNLAFDKFRESVPLFEKVLEYDPKNKEAISYLKVCHDFIDYFSRNTDSKGN